MKLNRQCLALAFPLLLVACDTGDLVDKADSNAPVAEDAGPAAVAAPDHGSAPVVTDTQTAPAVVSPP